ncbi:hypothetical protein NK8_71620 (plasmid) [Caballeronia sp. NK8]|uniref:hypothetical protein n=1 Tax=Caballeronia sp. NK8 TaxID=140098 RepID=UPI001BB7C193|nr:hypothetical protein [Caballeronia sp. NK8]BCQ28972.1 hypothetical protein NK8_71620 [Caballeronia sp. NK8]
MQMKSELPFDISRENLRLALRWAQLANYWREHWCALRVRQVELNARTLKRERDVIATCSDWNEIIASTQTIMRDHAAEMMSLMQESIGLELLGRNALAHVFSESLTDWQETWHGLNRIAGTGNAGESVLREVIRRNESGQASPRALVKGDQHVA